jgi:L-seryl-tRNA(Ser) seleniumtransferase
VSPASKSDLYRKLPGVDDLLHRPEFASLVQRNGQMAVTDAARAVLGRLRAEISSGHLDIAGIELALNGLTEAIERELRQALGFSLQTIINATGVVLHTNLGRAPLSSAALEHASEIATRYSNLELDLATGERGKRDVHVERLFHKLLASSMRPGSAENTDNLATIVVNNNAAAVLLALNTFAEGGEVIVSRGELVEIGGSFRIPDVMAKSQAVLKEVGTTNRTRISDYERAITDKTRLLLRVHRSNFEITGFTEQASLSELVQLAQRKNIPLMEDLGSGALVDLRSFGINDEPTLMDSLDAGVDVVTYSGDKLLGGPQAGILSGRREYIARMRSNSLFRALRVDKLTYAVLEASLLAYVKRQHDSIPVLRMMRLSKDDVRRRAEALLRHLSNTAIQAEIVDGESVIGGGAAPSATLPTSLLSVSCFGLSADELSMRLRAGTPPVIARVEEGRVLLDLRTIFPEQDATLARLLASIV